MTVKRGFASDNNSGIHPEILNAIEDANKGHSIGYGDDYWTREATELFKKEFGGSAEVFFALTGTGANILGLKSVLHTFNSIICAETSHIHTDECGSPEIFTGSKVIPVKTADGKIYPSAIEPHLHGFGSEHHSQPRVISITQASEMGTIYSVDEIKAIADLAHRHEMVLHMDGARISNAAVSLNLNFREFTSECGVDIISFGGTKNGLMMGEAVIILNPALAQFTRYYRKQAAQLCSKMRFISSQFIPYLKNGIWKKNAAHSNKMAAMLESGIKEIKAIRITQKVQANAVFAVVPGEIIPILRDKYFFYSWNEKRGEVRWMTSFDTTEEDIIDFTNLIRQLTES